MKLTNHKSTKQAGEILGITPRRVRQLIHEGRIPAVRLGRDLFMRLPDILYFKLNDRDRRLRCCQSALECHKMFPVNNPNNWLLKDFCDDCMREVFEEDRRDGERDERGNRCQKLT